LSHFELVFNKTAWLRLFNVTTTTFLFCYIKLKKNKKNLGVTLFRKNYKGSGYTLQVRATPIIIGVAVGYTLLSLTQGIPEINV